VEATVAELAGATLPVELLEELARHGTVKTFPKHAVIVVEGQPAEVLYLVLEGSLSVYVDDPSGKVAELSRLGPGQYFGELMLASKVRTASVRALAPSRLCIVRRNEFENILRRRPDLAFHVIQTLIARVRTLTEDVRSLALLNVYGRVTRLLRDSARKTDDGLLVDRMSQQLIAERVGASRSMVNRVLKDLSAGGYIDFARGRIRIRRSLPKNW
jgi:CRP/FNR family transcriptional regulator, cyclic AMP receptor protein